MGLPSGIDTATLQWGVLRISVEVTEHNLATYAIEDELTPSAAWTTPVPIPDDDGEIRFADIWRGALVFGAPALYVYLAGPTNRPLSLVTYSAEDDTALHNREVISETSITEDTIRIIDGQQFQTYYFDTESLRNISTEITVWVSFSPAE